VHTIVCENGCMPVDRLSVTVSAELGREVREAARQRGFSVSGWVAQAIEAGLRNQRLGEALAAWEAEQGPLTEEELAEADRTLDEAEQQAAARAARLAG
jgi:post-segregation antitoxin (ccd killing protein)